MTIYQAMKAYKLAHENEERLASIIVALEKKLCVLRPEHSQAQATANKTREVLLQTIHDNEPSAGGENQENNNDLRKGLFRIDAGVRGNARP
jgi:hypothetical protein